MNGSSDATYGKPTGFRGLLAQLGRGLGFLTWVNGSGQQGHDEVEHVTPQSSSNALGIHGSGLQRADLRCVLCPPASLL